MKKGIFLGIFYMGTFTVYHYVAPHKRTYMHVAFISSCKTFYNLIASDLKRINPEMVFTHFADCESFAEIPLPIFTHLIFKVEDFFLQEEVLKLIREKNPGLICIVPS